MKKILLFFVLAFIMPLGVNANTIHSIDIDVYLNRDGSANITEVWDVDGSDGTEWYKVINNMGNMKLYNFTVRMDGNLLLYKDWDINESLYQKRGYYGINYTNKGLELCFGKYDYNRHKFTLNYKLSNFIFNTDDSQLIYYNFIDKLSNVDFGKFSIDISSYYEFPNTLDVWGYGYKGYAYVSDGKISMSNEENSNMNNKSAILLAKFPLGTFDISNRIDGYDTFDKVHKMAEKGTFWLDLLDKIVNLLNIISYNFNMFLPFIFFAIFIIVGMITANASRYGYVDNKVLSKKEVPMYRDIPCNKDIYYANTLLKLNEFSHKNTNILGAIILKWVRTGKIKFKNEQKGIFNKETSVIDLTLNPLFDNEYEEKLFAMMYQASHDGYLEAREFERWCNSNYSQFLDLFKKIENSRISILREKGMIYTRTSKDECKYKNVMNNQIYDDSVKLYGLKKYLEEFSNMDSKEVMDVMLWDEYLMFAYLFGMADKVAKQLKHMYPEVVYQMENSNFDYDTILFINHISTRSVNTASAARSAAQSYSAGGGGFSSRGGGGSFGGGGGGSR